MGIFSQPQPNKEFGTKVNQSEYGKPYAVVMGTAQVPQSVLWIDGFTSKAAPSGKGSGSGGGKGGGKSGQYLYSADVIVALCNGPINGIGDVWSGQSWLGNPKLAESYTIAGPSYTYTPAQATNLAVDMGVGITNTYSGTYNDYGAPSSTVLSGNFSIRMNQVPFGTSLTTGTYSVNPVGNVYHFSSADVGLAVTVHYSYLVTTINRQENDIVPAGKQISVSGVGVGSTVNGDLGVVYTNTGVAFTKVSGTPSTAGTYSVSGNNPAVYKFATGDINALVTIGFSINDPSVISAGEPSSLNFTLNNGAQSQAPYSFLTASHPDAAFGYTGLATLLYQPMDLGMGAQVQENRFEVVTADVYGQGIQDCNPVQCIYKVLTDSMWGLGVGTIPFPTAAIDNIGAGTWGGPPATPGNILTNGTAWNWFASQNFFISPVIDSQNSAASEMSKWLEAGMCAAYVSEGLLKLVPYGDTSAAANGVVWTAPASYVVPVDDTSFVTEKEGVDPVKISRASAHDAWNVVQVQWNNRLNQYSPEITQESDQGLINRWGERREDPQNWDFIHTVTAATFAANMRIKHNSYIRNTYEFTLPFSYSYLEPMDIVLISTTSVWAASLNNVNLGITNLPVRITKIVDDPIKGLQITAEDYPWGAHQPTLYNKQLNESIQPANAYADPGNSEVVLFEATNRLTGFDGDQIWIGAMGVSSNWGATNIWVGQPTGSPPTVSEYKCIGTIKTPARLGTLNATFASGSDPDTTHTLVVNLAENCGSLDAGTTTDADYGNTLCFVDGEIVSYSALTYTGQNQVTMGATGSPPSGYLRRGQYGSTISSHSSGGLFLRLDSSIFKYTYDPQWRDQPLWFKFQSVNAFGLMAQDLSTLTPVSFTLPGVNPGSVDASSGLVVEASLGTNASYRPLSNPLTATDAGSSATISTASFNMQVAAQTVSYNGGSITALSYSTLYYIYFNDPNLAGGTVTYNATTTKEIAISGSTRYFVGSIITPVQGSGTSVGNNDGGAGAQTGNALIVPFYSSVGSGTGTITNPLNCINGGNGVTTIAVTATQTSTLTISVPPSIFGNFSQAFLQFNLATFGTFSNQATLTISITSPSSHTLYTHTFGIPLFYVDPPQYNITPYLNSYKDISGVVIRFTFAGVSGAGASLNLSNVQLALVG